MIGSLRGYTLGSFLVEADSSNLAGPELSAFFRFKASSSKHRILTCEKNTVLLVTMQAFYPISCNHRYIHRMPGGRPPKLKRSAFGERLFVIRQRLGLSQAQIAEKIGVSQQAYAGWERSTVAIRPEDILKLATLLNVSADELLGVSVKPKLKGGPIGKAQRVFERVSQLPRDRQQHIVRVVEELLAAQSLNSRK